MKRQEVYNAWKERKSQIEIAENFTDGVMIQVYQHAQKKRKPMFDIRQLAELISAHPLVQAGLIAAGAVAGFVRVAFVVCVFLGS